MQQLPFHRAYAFTYLCVALIMTACLLPGSQIPKVESNFLHLDKLVHAIMLMGVTWALLFGMASYKGNAVITKRELTIAFVISICFGLLIEVLQFTTTPDRHAEWGDLLADALGAFVALATQRWGLRLMAFVDKLCFSYWNEK